MSNLGQENNQLRIAIIGAGPSGMYAADALFKSKLNVRVDAFDRLPTPYGLLRGGVAPDHQKMKSVAAYYDRVAANENFHFYGNVRVGIDISINEIEAYYDAIVISCGAESDKQLGIAGEDLDGSYAATAFVGWYNGHPDYQSLSFNLQAKTAVIIGQGNVAIDVTRILSKTQAELANSDITHAAMEALKNSQIEDIYLVGRRGPVQSAFTKMEIEELGHLENCDIVVDKKDMEIGAACIKELEGNNKAQKNYEVLKAFSERELTGKPKRIHVKFFRSPLELSGTKAVESIKLGVNQLYGEAGSQSAKTTGESEIIDCQLVLRSVGYKGIGIHGVPIESRLGVIPNIKGQVTKEDGTLLPHLYVTGWIKRGPSGVLGTNKPDSTETINTLLSNLEKLPVAKKRNTDELLQLFKEKAIRYVTFSDWQKIDAEEKRRGESTGKPREKFTSVKDILTYLDQ